jgi:hypothetical protein
LHRSRLASIFETSLQPNSEAVGVGKAGEQEQSLAPVVKANATGSHSEGQDNVTKRLKLGSKSPPRPRSISPSLRRILAEDKSRAKRINNAEELTAEARLGEPAADPGTAILLAGVSPADEIDAELPHRVPDPGRELADVGIPRQAGPMPLQDTPGILTALDLPAARQARPLQAQVHATEAGKQAPEFHGSILHRHRGASIEEGSLGLDGFVRPESRDESRERIACRQRANSISEQAEPSLPIGGQPISQETNLGLSRGESGVGIEDFSPSVEIQGTGREDRNSRPWWSSGVYPWA